MWCCINLGGEVSPKTLLNWYENAFLSSIRMFPGRMHALAMIVQIIQRTVLYDQQTFKGSRPHALATRFHSLLASHPYDYHEESSVMRQDLQ